WLVVFLPQGGENNLGNPRAANLLVDATAAANQLPIYTRRDDYFDNFSKNIA
ncbi:hypothetical protein J6590_107799, partial [Homalodisca vitripennis]